MLKIFLISLMPVIFFFVLVMFVDGNRFVVKTYKIVSNKISGRHRFLVLADLHCKEYGKDNEKLLNEIDRQKPTEILIAGDMLTAKNGAEFSGVLSFLKIINEKYPVYYGNGNHEYRIKLYPDVYGNMGEEYQKGLSEIGICPLCNETVEIKDDNIVIYGLEIDRDYYKRGKKVSMSEEYLREKLGETDENKYNILLAHNPDYFDAYAKWGADLVVSGHVHGGMMRLPWLGGVISPALKLFPKYSGGRYEKTGKDGTCKTMILSNGLGSHTIPIRIFNPGQLVVIDVLNE